MARIGRRRATIRGAFTGCTSHPRRQHPINLHRPYQAVCRARSDSACRPIPVRPRPIAAFSAPLYRIGRKVRAAGYEFASRCEPPLIRYIVSQQLERLYTNRAGRRVCRPAHDSSDVRRDFQLRNWRLSGDGCHAAGLSVTLILRQNHSPDARPYNDELIARSNEQGRQRDGRLAHGRDVRQSPQAPSIVHAITDHEMRNPGKGGKVGRKQCTRAAFVDGHNGSNSTGAG